MTISLILDMARSGHGDRTAVAAEDDVLTYEEVGELSSRVGAVLQELGAQHVVYLGVGGTFFPVLLFGAAHVGIPMTPLNYRLSATQIRELIERLHQPVVVADAEYIDTLNGSHVMTIEAEEFTRRVRATEPIPPVDVDDESPAVVLFTSGTTSKPKAVILKHSNLSSYVFQTVEFGSQPETEVALISVPPYHIAGVGTILTNFYSGKRIVYLPRFDPQAWLALVSRHAVTSAMVVPTMLDRIVEEMRATSVALPDLKSLAYGGARMPRPLLMRAVEAMPQVSFTNAYGLTETSSTITLLGPEDHRAALVSDDPLVAARLGSVGKPVPGVEIDIRDPDGATVANGQRGQLWVRGPQVSGEYAELGSVLDADGWFPTKDIAYEDLEGYIFIEGRSDDTIIRGGENIAPAEIEDVIVEHPDVHSTVVVGVPDEQWGEIIVAVVVAQTNTTIDIESLRDFVRSRLRGSRTPDRIVVQTEIPTTPTGKIIRRDVVSALALSPTN